VAYFSKSTNGLLFNERRHAVMGPCTTSAIELSRELAGRFTPGMLVLADRGFYGFRLWAQAAATGADLLWRVKTNLRPRH
jgi:hypothetical protein